MKQTNNLSNCTVSFGFFWVKYFFKLTLRFGDVLVKLPKCTQQISDQNCFISPNLTSLLYLLLISPLGTHSLTQSPPKPYFWSVISGGKAQLIKLILISFSISHLLISFPCQLFSKIMERPFYWHNYDWQTPEFFSRFPFLFDEHLQTIFFFVCTPFGSLFISTFSKYQSTSRHKLIQNTGIRTHILRNKKQVCRLSLRSLTKKNFNVLSLSCVIFVTNKIFQKYIFSSDE